MSQVERLPIPCTGCSTDPCYHWPYCTELLSLRVERARRQKALDDCVGALADARVSSERLRNVETRSDMSAIENPNGSTEGATGTVNLTGRGTSDPSFAAVQRLASECDELRVENEQLRAERDAIKAVLRLQEHITILTEEGQREIERLRASVDQHNEVLREQTERAVAAEDSGERLRALLRRLYEWDHMDSAGDGPYWRSEIERVLDQV